MYGGRSATSRSVGVLNANCRDGSSLTTRAAPAIGGRRADVVEQVVGEAPAAMAGEAQRLAVVELEAALGGVRDRGLVAFDPAVERRDSRARTSARRPRPPARSVSILIGASRQRRLELRHIGGVRAEALLDDLDLHRVSVSHSSTSSRSRPTSSPAPRVSDCAHPSRTAPSGMSDADQRLRPARGELAGIVPALCLRDRPAELRQVAGDAGGLPGCGQRRIEEQLAAEVDQRLVGDRLRRLAPIHRFHRVEVR